MRRKRTEPDQRLLPLVNEVGMNITITLDFSELATFSDEQITAAFEGLAKVVAANRAGGD